MKYNQVTDYKLPPAWPPVVYVYVCLVDDGVWALGVCTFQVRREERESWRGLTCVSVRRVRTHHQAPSHLIWQPSPSHSPANHRYQGYDALNIKESWSGICPSRFPLNIYFFIEKRLKTVSMTWWHHVEVKGPAATTIQGTRLIIRLRIISIMYYCSMCIYSSFYTNISSSFDF